MTTHRGTAKENERRAARALGGERIPCSGNGQMKGDVHHDEFFVEAKLRAKLSIYPWMKKAIEQATEEGKGKTPILVVRQKHSKRGDLVVISLEDFTKLLEQRDRLVLE